MHQTKASELVSLVQYAHIELYSLKRQDKVRPNCKHQPTYPCYSLCELTALRVAHDWFCGDPPSHGLCIVYVYIFVARQRELEESMSIPGHRQRPVDSLLRLKRQSR